MSYYIAPYLYFYFMTEPTSSSDSLREDLGEMLGYLEIYADRKIQLAKLSAAERIARLTSSLISLLVFVLTVPLCLVVFSIGVAYWLHESWNWSQANAFFLIAGFYLLMGIVVYFFRHQLFTNSVIKNLFDEQE